MNYLITRLNSTIKKEFPKKIFYNYDDILSKFSTLLQFKFLTQIWYPLQE